MNPVPLEHKIAFSGQVCDICYETSLKPLWLGHSVVAENRDGHFFHTDCSYIWLRTKKTCPTCKVPIKIGSTNSLRNRMLLLNHNSFIMSISTAINLLVSHAFNNRCNLHSGMHVSAVSTAAAFYNLSFVFNKTCNSDHELRFMIYGGVLLGLSYSVSTMIVRDLLSFGEHILSQTDSKYGSTPVNCVAIIISGIALYSLFTLSSAKVSQEKRWSYGVAQFISTAALVQGIGFVINK